mgnify:CR=1 FL=1
MELVSYYKDRLTALFNALQAEFDDITQNGVIDYDEAQRGKEHVIDFQQNLHLLKKQVNDDLRQTRRHYRYQVEKAEDREARHMLREEEINKLASYNKVVEIIDRMLLDSEGSKQTFSEMIGELRLERATLAPDEILPIQLETQDTPPLEFMVNSRELLGLISKWRDLIKIMQRKSTDDRYKPRHMAQFKGARKSLEIAIEDIENLIMSSLESEENKPDEV